MSFAEKPYLLVWDGECETCRRCVVWVVTKDEKNAILPLTPRGVPSPPMTEELHARAKEAVLLLTPEGRALSGGRACIEVLRLLGRERTARLLGRPSLAGCVEAAYRAAARTRGWWGRLLPARKLGG